MQCVKPKIEFDVETICLAGSAEGDLTVHARMLVEKFANRACNVEMDPLFNFIIINLSKNEHVFAWGIHHMISDTFSIGIIFGDIWLLYRSFVECQAAHLPPPNKGYLEYAVWQNERRSKWAEDHGFYWREILGRTERLRWPLRPAPVQQDGDGRKAMKLRIVPHVYLELCSLARRAHTTVAMVLLGSYALLVSSWCGQKKFIVPVNVTGRSRPEHRYVVGYFAHLLCVSIDLTGNRTFIGLLDKVSREFRDALSHQDFGRVIAENSVLISDSFFSWMPWTWDQISGMPTPRFCEENGLVISEFPFKASNTGDELALSGIGVSFWRKDEGAEGAMTFDPKIIPASVAELFECELVRIVEQVGSNPDTELAMLRSFRESR